MNLTANIKNGQKINIPSGFAAINANDMIEVGGPGTEAWPVGSIDYAVNAPAGVIAGQTPVASAALPGPYRQPICRDRLGNIYIAGTNSSGNLVIFKYTATGSLISSVIVDATATSVNAAHMFQLSSGGYAVVYARASGALYFVIFDSALNVIAGPSSVATQYHSTNSVYHSACALSGGGFAIAFQSSAGTAINLVTYSNTGAAVLAATNVQTLAGTAASAFLKIAQLASGNLVVAYRSTMTAGGNAGTGFNIVTTGGGAIAGPTNMDTTSTFGLLDISVMSTVFSLAEANGTNLICGVYANAGTLQGSLFTVGNTLNSAVYPQKKLLNDGTQFWLVWFSSVANGVYVVQIPATGGSGVAASALSGGVFNATTFALDAEIINGLIAVLGASSATAGQFFMTIGLPDSSIGTLAPYIRSAPSSFGTTAATTGSNGPRLISGSAGLYLGPNGPAGQPATLSIAGSFTAILCYDQQNTAAQFLGIQKLEASAILGVAITSVAAAAAGTNVAVNPGPGDYPTNLLGGTPGQSFSHSSANPAGTNGILFGSGAGLAGIADGPFASGSSGDFTTGDIKGSFNTPGSSWLYCTGTIGAAGSGATNASGISVQPLYIFCWNTFSNSICPVTGGRGSSALADFNAGKTLQLPDARGRVFAGRDNMLGTAANRLTTAGSGVDGTTLGASGGAQVETVTSGNESYDYGNVGAGGIVVAGYPHQHQVTTVTVQPVIVGNIFIHL